MGKPNSNDEKVVIVNYYFVCKNIIDQKEELEIDDDGSGGVITPPISEMATMNETKGLNIPWVNCCGGSILLTQPSFSFLSMTFKNMLVMWF